MNNDNAVDIQTLSVSALNRSAKRLLEESFPVVYVVGEISNFSCPRSGHWYFTLKDSGAQIRCAMFKGANHYVDFSPKDGDEVLIRAKLSLYEDRGDYQLIVGQLSLSGIGRLQQAFERLKKSLSAEGLFDPARKKSIPHFPKRITVITSATGAAVRDILSTILKRYPCVKIYLYPVSVQGAHAQFEIVKALNLVGETDTDTIILARGGGSLEDLWPFNEEAVARAIASCPIPVISGVGHETDFTIADFVADARAPTPTSAAQMATPDTDYLLQQVVSLEQRLIRNIERKIEHCNLALENAEARLIHPGDVLKQQRKACIHYIRQIRSILLQRLMLNKQQLSSAAQLLNATSPLATMARGYSVITDKDGNILKTVETVKKAQEISIQVSDGKIKATVNQ